MSALFNILIDFSWWKVKWTSLSCEQVGLAKVSRLTFGSFHNGWKIFQLLWKVSWEKYNMFMLLYLKGIFLKTLLTVIRDQTCETFAILTKCKLQWLLYLFTSLLYWLSPVCNMVTWYLDTVSTLQCTLYSIKQTRKLRKFSFYLHSVSNLIKI